MKFLALEAHDPEWDQIIGSMPYDLRDIHFSSGYARAQEKIGFKGYLLALVTDHYTVAQPFFLRPISDRFDASTVGYGGPVANDMIPSRSHGEAFHEHVLEWLAQSGVVSEFCLLNPLFEAAQLYLLWETKAWTRRMECYLLFLDRPEVMMERMDHGRRQRIAKAPERGMKAERVDPTEEAIAQFHSLYMATMIRHHAPQRWRYPKEYFRALFDELGDRAALVRTTGPDGMTSASIILFGKLAAYYAMTGNIFATPAGSNDLVIMEAARLAKERGCTWLHLGGGPTEGLRKFKASFGSVEVPVYSYQRVFDAGMYRALCEEAGVDPMQSGSFPAYRNAEFV